MCDSQTSKFEFALIRQRLPAVGRMLAYATMLLLGMGIWPGGVHGAQEGGHPGSEEQVNWEKLSAELSGFEIHDSLRLSLFAAEPQFVNPTNIDIDQLGRVWICEAVNYRHFRNRDQQPRKEGDRILVLEDSDGDGRADRVTTFFQSPEIDSPHGICVLGNRVIVSAGDSVRVLTDTDGDLKADKNEILFTGIQGVQHDHGIHAFVFGPDGKLYFNFGNEGKRLKDKNGQPIVDKAGRRIEMNRPYQNGMIFRCELDGSDVETLAWNFRNNWEVCVDSFGRMWQSDNDDDGNRATRINYVIPYGNYGFCDEFTGAGWRAGKIGQAADIPNRHWHQNDPGVIPNLLITGAGSPTGICVHEGISFIPEFRNQIIHCDAGPNVVRCYPVVPKGGGFSASMVTLMDGAKNNKWFRPSDVCVAPDGSLLVADWYDPGVGGHRMQDILGGRLYRLIPKDAEKAYRAPVLDWETPTGLVQALCSPNQATRYLAWEAIGQKTVTMAAALAKLARHENPRFRARALWALAVHFDDDVATTLELVNALKDRDPAVRATVYRIAQQAGGSALAKDIWQNANFDDPSPLVRCELLISMRQPGGMPFRVESWVQLVGTCPEGDRWYLETAGLAAEGHWDECIAVARQQDWWNSESSLARSLSWRSRGADSIRIMASWIRQGEMDQATVQRMLRAMEMRRHEPDPNVQQELARHWRSLAFEWELDDPATAKMVRYESLCRLSNAPLGETEMSELREFAISLRGTQEHLALVRKFQLEEEYDVVFEEAMSSESPQFSVDALRLLLDAEQFEFLIARLRQISTEQSSNFGRLADLLTKTGHSRVAIPLLTVAKENSVALDHRKRAVLAMGQHRKASEELLDWVRTKDYDPAIEPALVAALHNAASPKVRSESRNLFPPPEGERSRAVPEIAVLMRLRGDRGRGAEIYATKEAQCANCHVVRGEGQQVGPELTEIGDKLTRAAIFESILYPSAGIAHGYENWTVQTVDGDLLTGLLISEDVDSLTIQGADGIKRTLPLDELEGRKLQTLSLMPAGLHEALTDQELADIAAYLLTLKKK